ncbi:uncharacterized protein LOC122264680 isoform X2 [Penaeus japonicus]|nr:uncharacterized protein LOC122264680 isoform X2 [Penaeus japonicus]
MPISEGNKATKTKAEASPAKKKEMKQQSAEKENKEKEATLPVEEKAQDEAKGGKKKRVRRKKRKNSTAEPAESQSPDKKAKLESTDTGTKNKKKKNVNEPMVLEGDLLSIYLKREQENNERTLLICTKAPEVKDAISFRIKQVGSYFAEFKTKEEAKKNKKELEKLEGIQSVTHPTVKEDKRTVNPCRLYIHHVPSEVTLEDLQEAFSTAEGVKFNSAKGYATPFYSTKEETEKAFRGAENLVVKGYKLNVLYSRSAKKG